MANKIISGTEGTIEYDLVTLYNVPEGGRWQFAGEFLNYMDAYDHAIRSGFKRWQLLVNFNGIETVHPRSGYFVP